MDQKSPGFRGNLAIKNEARAALPFDESFEVRDGILQSHHNDQATGRTDAHAARLGERLCGVWVADSRASHFLTNIVNFEDLRDTIAQNAEAGFQPADIFGSGRFFEPWSVAFVHRPNASASWQITTDAQAFKRRHEAMLHQGYSLTGFNRRHRGINAVWEPSSIREQPVAWNMDWPELMTLDMAQRKRGFRVAFIERYGPSGAHYAAVWEPGDGEQLIEAPGGLNGGTSSSLALMVDRYADAGLGIHAMGHNEYPVVVYRSADASAARRYASLPLTRFQAFDAQCRAAGFRLSAISHAAWQDDAPASART